VAVHAYCVAGLLDWKSRSHQVVIFNVTWSWHRNAKIQCCFLLVSWCFVYC